MKILHIVNDYNFTKVHKELIQSIDKKEVEQVVFIPLKNRCNVGKNEFETLVKASSFIYSKKLLFLHKFFFEYRISFLFKSMQKSIDLKSIDIVHASTLFVDGGLALEIKKKYNTPYIVAVRNTDLNFYLKYRKDLYSRAFEILQHAEKIVFISESNYNIFRFSKFGRHFIRKCTNNKIEVICNGINGDWLNSICSYKKNKESSGKNFLFVGRFDKNKNVVNLLKAFVQFNLINGFKHNMILIGGGGGEHSKVVSFIKDKEYIKFLGIVNDRSRLCKVFSNVDFFTMCSYKETFGLVYIESLSQGVPILYSKGQGIDGTFGSLNVGVSVFPNDLDSIVIGLNKLLHTEFEDINNIDFARFNWGNISRSYLNIYKEILNYD